MLGRDFKKFIELLNANDVKYPGGRRIWLMPKIWNIDEVIIKAHAD